MAFPTKDIFTFDHTVQADYPNWIPSVTKTNMNARGEELRLALNAVVNLLNATGAGVSGAKNTAMTPIAVIGTQADVQTVVEAIVTRLQAVTAGLSGAKFIGVETIVGLTGNDVQTLISALKAYTDAYKTELATTAGAGLIGATAPSGLVGTTVQALINDSVSKVLLMANTTVYVPTTQYNPATKGYADGVVAGVILGQIPDASLTYAKLAMSLKSLLTIFPQNGLINLEGMTIGSFTLTLTPVLLGTITLG